MKMLRSVQNLCWINTKLLFVPKRNLTDTEVSTALRPFYFVVHPDLFGRHPEERAVNESSLQQLSSVLNTLQSKGPIRPITLPFYVKDKSRRSVGFRPVKIDIKDRDIRSAILNILRSCELPTDYVDSIEKPQPTAHDSEFKLKVNDIDFANITEDDPIYASYVVNQSIRNARDSMRLITWLKTNYESALRKSEERRPSREEIEKLCNLLKENLELKEIKWDCGWNDTHFRGCLLAFKSLTEHHPEDMHNLKGRILVFSNFTGVSLDGHVMLYSGEVRRNWLDFIKNIHIHDMTLSRIPAFEKSLSHVLRNIKIGRRKFMPKAKAMDYENNLRQITTSLNDYIGRKAFPKEWPKSLEDHEIVVETEAGPLMVSPTGQFIVPSTIPGTMLVNFITNNLKEASQKNKEYQRDKHIERSLHKKAFEELELEVLMKDDNVTPSLMISCLEKLLENKFQILVYTKGLHLNIATYYSVLSDGVTCIPWNFKL